MADANVGEITAVLRVRTEEWTRGLTQAQQQLAQFQTGLTQRMTPAVQQAQQALTQTTQRAQQMGQALQQAGQSAQAAGGQMTQAATQATRAMDQASAATSSFGSAWRNISQMAGALGIVTSISGIISSLKDLATQTVQVGARLESLRTTLTAISGSSTEGGRQFQFLVQTAQRLGVALEPLAQGWRQLTAASSQAGLPMAQQQRLLVALSTEGRRTGMSNEELSRSIQALAQMASKGVVSMEEWRGQLGDSMVRATAALAAGMGRTTEEVIKLIEAGSLRFVPMAQAFTRGLEQIGGGSEKMAETSTTAWNRMTTEFKLLADAIMKSGLSEYLKTVADNLREAAKFVREDVIRRPADVPGLSAEDLARVPQREQAQIDTFRRLIASEERAPRNPPEYLANLKAQLAERLELAKTLKAEADAQGAVTTEANKTTSAREQELEHVQAVKKVLEEIHAGDLAFRHKAAAVPELFGRPQGTAEEVEKFRQGQLDARRKGLEALAELRAPAGFTLPPEVQAGVEAARRGHSDIEAAMKQADEAERTRTQRQREAETERRRLAREAESARKREAAEIEQDFRAQRQERWKDLDIFGLTLSPEQETALKEEATAQRDRIRAFAESFDIFDLELAPEQEAARRREAAFDLRLRQQLEQQQLSRIQRPEARMRHEAERENIPMTAEREAQFARWKQLREEQERLNAAVEVWRDLSQGVGAAWVNALESVASGTATVAEAFRAMGQSILRTMADIAAQQATQAFFKLGAAILTSALTGAVAPTAASSGPSSLAPSSSFLGTQLAPQAAFAFTGAQHGAHITQPTMVLTGEQRSSEWVMNDRQMQTLMTSAVRQSSSGGQEGQVIVNNFPSKQAAEQDAAQRRSQGHRVVLNEVLADVSRGESSELLRMLRALQK